MDKKTMETLEEIHNKYSTKEHDEIIISDIFRPHMWDEEIKCLQKQ